MPGGQGAPGVVFVLMAGGFSPPPLGLAAGCSVLDMHLTRELTVLGRWQEAVATLDRAGVAQGHLCLCGGSTPLPESTMGLLRTVVDKSDYRGPAGALRDACERLHPDTTILAAEAARCCTANLSELVTFHVQRGVEVTVGRNADESPAGLYVLSRRMLDRVPQVGFMDLKEQWLSKLVGGGVEVAVYELPGAGAPLLRTRADFLRSVRAMGSAEPVEQERGLEPRILTSRACTASVVCDGATVAPDAVIVDSVLLPGSRVGGGALVARSIVGPGGVVEEGAEIVDAVVGPTGITRDGELKGERTP